MKITDKMAVEFSIKGHEIEGEKRNEIDERMNK